MKLKQPLLGGGPEIPDVLGYLWDWFFDISLGIASSGMAPAQITWRDVEAWSGLTGNILEPWEAKTIVILGMKRASILSEKLESSTKTPTSGRKS